MRGRWSCLECPAGSVHPVLLPSQDYKGRWKIRRPVESINSPSLRHSVYTALFIITEKASSVRVSKMKFVLVNALAVAGITMAQQTGWGQCGGRDWTGPVTCVSGYFCQYSNEWYSQCVPGKYLRTPRGQFPLSALTQCYLPRHWPPDLD